jgi:hypothetical protein
MLIVILLRVSVVIVCVSSFVVVVRSVVLLRDSLPIGISVASPIAKDFQNSESAPFSLANRQAQHRQKPPEQVARQVPMPIRKPAQRRLLQASEP